MKTLRLSLGLLAALLLAVPALLGALWVWSGSATSLATALALAQPYLPAGQSLVYKDVTGSLRDGGTLGSLRWQQGTLSVEARQVSVAWTLRHLLDGELRISQLKVGHLRIADSGPSNSPTPPTDLRLPLKLSTPFTVDTLEWAMGTPLQASGLTGNYAFDSYSHKLDVLQGHISSGTYRLKGSLQALAPMALALQLDGSLPSTVPGRREPVQVRAHAELSGALAGPDAVLALAAELEPALKSPQAMQAQITARLQPWQTQPVASAQARWQALDLAALWPQAPQTRLSGEADVTPAGAGWRAQVKLTNTLSGPWNLQRLPLSALNARLGFAQGLWTAESLQASGAGGRMQAKGQFTDLPHWQGQASLQGVNPAALDSRLAASVLSGEFKAQQTPAGIALDGHLQTPEARLQGQLSYQPPTQAVKGELKLSLPGATATVRGHLAPTQGEGDLALTLADAAQASQWLQRTAGLASPLGQTRLQGGAELKAHWQGGWEALGQSLQIQAQLSAPQLQVLAAKQPTEPALTLRGLQANLSGNLRALNLNLQTQAESGSRQFALQAQAQGGRTSASHWQAQLVKAQLSAQDSQRPGTWTLKTPDPIALNWEQNGAQSQLKISAGRALLSGPVPGVASLNWQDAQWSPAQWQTRGSLQNLPLAWLELIGQTQVANLGLRGDLLFGGQWNASGGDTLRLSATLARTSGDLQLLTEDATLGTVRAGVREARLTLTAVDETVSAQLQWASERAGQAQARLGTRLQHQDGAWLWPADAPLSGTVSVQLPPVGAWSLLAPPGWRLRGTLDANATLSGTRGEPQWRGTLAAQDLAVRSVVDGIDFSQGKLRASLDGQRLNIDSFTLQGAGGASGGLLTLKGSVLWLPGGEPARTAPASTLASRLRISLEATAQSLRLSTRADRRLVVSGQLAAQLVDARLILSGTLKADQALFILPEDTAPQLGDDVVVRQPNAARPPAKASYAKTLRITPEVAVTLDLGPDFAVRGLGLVTRLRGSLVLRSTPNGLPSLSGDLRTVRGTYKAYGQQLDIEEGLLHFSGAFNNPALNILAIRPNLQQRVGVQISGTALAPVVRLYADPELPDAEKLAWLVLGRSAANGGAESAVLQQAALALLGGKGKSLPSSLADTLGLDELSMRGATNSADGTSTGAAVTLGKRLSRDIYVAYERSLAGTLGTFYIFYDLSRRFTLRAQTGEQSAVDVIFTLRYD